MAPAVASWAERQDPFALWISVITVMEIEIGIARVERRDPAQGTLLRGWLHDRLLPTFADRILPLDLPAVRATAALHVPDPRPERDALIAGTALARRLTVVTRNVTDFRPMKVAVLDPWNA